MQGFTGIIKGEAGGVSAPFPPLSNPIIEVSEMTHSNLPNPEQLKKLEPRFWAKVDKHGPMHPVLKTRCWVWTGGVTGTPARYGVIKRNCKRILVHRYSFFLANGQWPEPMCCHHCDNPPCVNPEHLFEGTNDDNMADMVAKGRCKRTVFITHCRNGHEYTPENTGTQISGRYCRACKKRNNAAAYKTRFKD